MINDEVRRKFPCFAPGKSKKYYKTNKFFWNNDLNTLWNDMYDKEKQFTNLDLEVEPIPGIK